MGRTLRTLALTLTLSLSLSHSLSLTLTLTLALTASLSLSLSPSHSDSLTLSLTHSLTVALTLSLPLSLSLSGAAVRERAVRRELSPDSGRCLHDADPPRGRAHAQARDMGYCGVSHPGGNPGANR